MDKFKMRRGRVVGYCPELREAIQSATVLKYYSDSTRRDDPLHNAPAAWQEHLFERDLIRGLIGGDIHDAEDLSFVEMVYEAIDDDFLRDAIEEGTLKDLRLDDRGYYLATGEFSSNETDFR